MNPNRYLTAIYHVITSLLCVVLLCACAHEKKYRIGVSQCSSDDWREKMNDEILREALFHEDAEVEIRSAQDCNEKQIEDIRYFINNGFDVIAVAPNEADAITPVVREAYEKGIPVVLFDRNINGDYYTAIMGTDNKEIGSMAAKYANMLLRDGGRIIELYGLEGSTPADDRHSGFAERLIEYPGLELVGSGEGRWNYETALSKADSLLRLYPDTRLIFAHNDRMAIAGREAARRLGMDVKVIGIDAAPNIGIKAVADGVIDATFLYPTEGDRLISTCMAIVHGRHFDRHILLPSASAVDNTNADILLLQNKALKAESDRIHKLKAQVDDYWERHSAQTTLLYVVVFCAVLLVGVIFLLLRAFWQRKRHQNVLEENNRLLAEQRDMQVKLNSSLEEATQSKLRFFTSVSHDLRTPITLIADPIQQLADAPNLNEEQRMLARMANKNVHIMKRMINQILDFRKIENGLLEPQLCEIDFAASARGWLQSFGMVALRRHIKLEVEIPDKPMPVAVDSEMIERVVFNLMANAIKYTPDNGNIKFACEYTAQMLEFSVRDSGIGISEEHSERVFDQFYQVDPSRKSGNGIGLSLVKAFVELHNGNIRVESEPGRGSCFTVSIPVGHVEGDGSNVAGALIGADTVSTELDPIENSVAADTGGKPLVLVIEDNSDLLKLLRQTLSGDYQVLTAANGADGLRMAMKYVPDLVVCDVMMPVMDGLECLKRLKSEVATSHIPVLMLTACALDEQRLAGYDCGADGYMPKPFNRDMLISRCRNLIANRKRVFGAAAGQDAVKIGKIQEPAKVQASENERLTPQGADIDNDFYNRFIDIFKANMSNSELNVEFLASELGLGRSQFYRKIKALTNFSPVELIRDLRLRHARVLLTTTDSSVSEIAYEVGFSSPAYFSKCYREAYGQTPTELREQMGK
ncbi:MAG: substrate-binding domain-containing protein [Muribaculaceae bacterium]|nr:substrate-binding domain-containing protein [Muribaculaceae bacterium]